MSDSVEDSSTRTGLWIVFAVVFAVVVGVLGSVVVRQHGHGKAAAPVASAAKAGPAEGASFFEGPLEGDVIGTVYFAVGQSKLPDGAQPMLDKAVAAAQEAPQRRIVLSGFHDASGTAGANAELAKARALRVREALTADGLSASRIALRKPEVTLGDGSDSEARRVEIRLVD